jgi:hypothetical protein
VLSAAALALAEVGPGPLSIDGDRRHGPGWAAFALATAALGSAAAHAYSAGQAEPASQPPAPQPPVQAEADQQAPAGA